MFRSRGFLLCLTLLTALWWAPVQALPTVDQVHAALQRGDDAGAERMMREVVAAKPDSARAHYVLAEILAHQRRFDEAAAQARRARALDPALSFTDPAKFTAFEQLLQREQAGAARAARSPALDAPALPARAAPAAPAASSPGGVPVWLLVVGAVVFIALAAGWMRRRTAAPAPAALGGGYGGMPGSAYGAGYGPQAPGAGGPGLMGVGLAAAGGVAAGMLAERLLHGDHDEPRSAPRDSGSAGGLVPGSFDGGWDDGAASQLASRDIDLGQGDGWGGSDGGGFDGGSSGGDW